LECNRDCGGTCTDEAKIGLQGGPGRNFASIFDHVKIERISERTAGESGR
jgi:hypothetical protein